MIKLSDYLSYLSSEIIQARKNLDLKSIENAKAYAEHEYLKYFKAPRFTMPSIKLEVPIEISALDSDTKYNFKMDDDVFLYEVNKNLAVIEKKYNVTLESFTKEKISTREFKSVIAKLEKQDQRYIGDLNYNFKRGDIKRIIPIVKPLKPSLDFNALNEKDTIVDKEIETVIFDAFKKLSKPSKVRLNNIYISPGIVSLKTGEDAKDNEKNKILLKLNVELVEEDIKITKIKDADGNEYEEVMLD